MKPGLKKAVYSLKSLKKVLKKLLYRLGPTLPNPLETSLYRTPSSNDNRTIPSRQARSSNAILRVSNLNF